MRLLVTGGAGFIGANYVQQVLAAHPDDSIVTLDLLTYAGNLANLESVLDDPRHRFVRGDIADRAAVAAAIGDGVDAIVNFAAESHVDRSIADAGAFLATNVLGTQVLLDAARAHGVGRFLQVSTDEVYGSLGPSGAFSEETPLAPNSPYAASKAAADLLVRAAHHTHGLPAFVTRCSNNYGPYQFPEKLIPLFVTNALADQPLPLYGDGRQVRDWIHVEDHCRGIDLVLREGRVGEVYNLGGGNERENIEIAGCILETLGKPRSLIRHVTDRLGHDRRYAIDARKIERELGWKPRRDFARGLRDTIEWYRAHRAWWEAVRSGAYLDYYEGMYGQRLRGAAGAEEDRT
ncbi:MAG: dTDP-glucose 4,6-dehydratase [Deltaproteobacteria bacterium]|nr:dTDP-glucose 4,6-dehydratase [Deltaproteobacteria bacterium]